MSKTWTLDAMGVLTIRPGFRKRKGKPDFYARREEIKAIVVEVGVSKITDDVFEGCTSLRRIILHSKVIDSLSWVPEGAELIKQFMELER